MAKFNHTGHKELWDWLVQNPDKEKFEWTGWEKNGGKYQIPSWHCFACEYDEEYGEEEGLYDCDGCPLVWPDVKCAIGYDSLYQKWDGETDLKKRSELACQIRDLPVREGVECE